MGFATGDRLGPYEIRGIIGKGGMGEVYRAFDARLNREVAIKSSAERFSDRFGREARAVAALNHPHVCTLYDTGSAPGVPGYLVLEFVEGTEPRGPMGLDEALRVAGQLASALAAAHEKGIVHRDLKPANIKVRRDGSVKVLDFGLAKQVHGDALEVPTETVEVTMTGTVMGTPAYMAPEQARGGDVDKRADIWAFGVVLYELLTGQRPFDGGSVTATLGAIQTKEPDLARVPARVRRLLRACLKKDPGERLADISDWRLLLDDVGDTAVASSAGRGRMRDWLGWVAAAAGLAVGAYALMRPVPTATAAVPSVFNLPIPGGVGETATFAVSPDGRTLAMSVQEDGRFQLRVRALDSLEARVLPGADGAREPFWSPDGERIGFFADGALKTIPLTGDPPTTIASTGFDILGATWGPRAIVYAAAGRLLRVGETGGTPEVLYEGRILRNPSFLADGVRFTYTADSSVQIGSLDKTPPIDLKTTTLRAQATPDGYFFSAQSGRLMAQRFGADPSAFEGSPTVVTSALTQFGARDYSIGGTTAAYLTPQIKRLSWVNRAGVATEHLGLLRAWTYFRLSPDGAKVAFNEMFDGRGHIVLFDLRRGTTERLTSQGANLYPTFSRDGRQLAFSSMRSGRRPSPYVTTVGSAPNQEELFGEVGLNTGEPWDWSPDGKHVLYRADGDLWIVPRTGTGKAYKFAESPFEEVGGAFSPDGRWIAYPSTESGRPEVYVRPFPESARVRYTVSSGGGQATWWRRDGRELYFVGSDGWLHAVSVTPVDGTLQFGTPERLFALGVWDGMRRYEPSPDGQRFLVATPGPDGANLTVLLNWQQAVGR